MTKDEARELLDKAGLFFDYDPEDDDPSFAQMLNMNDVWGWACADGEDVPDEELPELGHLFYSYGWCGVLYWVSQRNDHMKSEFYHYNRMIEFVEHEEQIKSKYPSESTRAYHKTSYKIQGKR